MTELTAEKPLVGRRVTGVRRLARSELGPGWLHLQGTTVLELDDGSLLFASGPVDSPTPELHRCGQNRAIVTRVVPPRSRR